jgi:hypothetical protein
MKLLHRALLPARHLGTIVGRWRKDASRGRAGVAGPDSGLARQTAAFDAMARQLEARFKAIIEDQAEFISRLAPGFTFTFVNRAYAAQLARLVAERHPYEGDHLHLEMADRPV